MFNYKCPVCGTWNERSSSACEICKCNLTSTTYIISLPNWSSANSNIKEIVNVPKMCSSCGTSDELTSIVIKGTSRFNNVIETLEWPTMICKACDEKKFKISQITLRKAPMEEAKISIISKKIVTFLLPVCFLALCLTILLVPFEKSAGFGAIALNIAGGICISTGIISLILFVLMTIADPAYSPKKTAENERRTMELKEKSLQEFAKEAKYWTHPYQPIEIGEGHSLTVYSEEYARALHKSNSSILRQID